MENPSDYRAGSPFAPESPDELLDTTATSGEAADDRRTSATADAPLAAGQAETAAGQAETAAGQPETLSEGVWGQTAAAAVYAAVILLAFATVCWWLFPGGGVAVAALGAVVSLLGLSSSHFRLAVIALSLHGVLFFACYLRAI